MGILGLEIVDRPLDRESVIGDQMHPEARGWRGRRQGRYLLLEVGMELLCAVSFARRGITAEDYQLFRMSVMGMYLSNCGIPTGIATLLLIVCVSDVDYGKSSCLHGLLSGGLIATESRADGYELRDPFLQYDRNFHIFSSPLRQDWLSRSFCAHFFIWFVVTLYCKAVARHIFPKIIYSSPLLAGSVVTPQFLDLCNVPAIQHSLGIILFS